MSLNSARERCRRAEPREDLFLEEACARSSAPIGPAREPFAGIETELELRRALADLRDLRDGLVDPAVALEALGEGHFRAAPAQRTRNCWRSFKPCKHFCRRKTSSPSPTSTGAPPHSAGFNVPECFRAGFLLRLLRLTQIQLDFQAVASFQTTLFPAWRATESRRRQFPERFYGATCKKQSTEPAENNAPVWHPPACSTTIPGASTPTCQQNGIANCLAPSACDESRVARDPTAERDEKIPFHEIGVIAHSLETYGSTVKAICREHRIPIAGISSPLVEQPLAKAVILLGLPGKIFAQPGDRFFHRLMFSSTTFTERKITRARIMGL